ncbi:P-loop NTPase fold protein (plasmid) [Bacillus cereus]|uniref:P-loop NTPase fold protein n=1 Tax=Bacillus cereus TaxID=1396 RepID=UPI001FF15D31|nr:P-loop NTPase fold protein [Bacillus cereus]UOX98930.1 P-loop NTPase fold protein [Bacillus cereus]
MIRVSKAEKPNIYTDQKFIERIKNFNDELKQNNKPNFDYFYIFKSKLLEYLWEETGGKCVYCETFLGRIGNGDVDHFFPKSRYPDLTFEWSNMFFACNTCNSLKANKDPNSFKIVHPSQDNPSDHLKKNREGVYIPLTEKGSNTINLFRLNSLKKAEHNMMQRLFDRMTSNPKGEDGLNDQVASEDLLGRELLVNELSSFYTEYNEGNSSPLYIGIFSRWGMGKSSFIEMLTKNIETNNSETNKYLVCKVDCSLFHKKEKLWITILNKLLDEISTMKKKKKSKKKQRTEKQEKIFKYNFFSFKTKFFFYNLLAWLKRRWKLNGLLFLSLIGIYYLITKSFPHVPIPKDYKEITALITVITLVFTLIKTRTLIFKQNVFLQDDRNEESSFIRSTKEYEQLITLINKVKKKKNLKILLVLDEMDRMHRDLLPDIIELIQLFKGLNNKQLIKKRNAESDESVISFVFSFNQDMLFPVIGKSVSLDDNQLFINSYRDYEGYVEGEGKNAYLNFYKLGKEYMDKYLDLTVYLEEEIDYTQLMEALFKEDKVIGANKAKKIPSDNEEEEKLEKVYSEREPAQQSAPNSSFNSNKQELPSFTELEMKIIRETVQKNASKVEPRKVKRLKNALIMLKKLNKEIDSIEKEDSYEEELRDFILKFLEIKNCEQQVSDLSYNEIATTVENSIKDKSSNSRVNMTRRLKYTEYFIHNKIKN